MRFRPALSNGCEDNGTERLPASRVSRATFEDTARSAAARAAIESVVFAPPTVLPDRGVAWRAESDDVIVARFDLPPDRQRNLDRINVTRGRLEVSYTSNRRVSRMRARTDPAGGLHPFAYEFDLSAEARSGTEMALRLCADALKPPQAVGDSVHGGRITFYG